MSSLENTTTQAAARSPHAETTCRILGFISDGYKGNVSVRMWDGQTWRLGTGQAAFTLVLNHPGSLRAMLWPFNRAALGEAYIFDDVDVEGDVVAFVAWLRHLLKVPDRTSVWEKLWLFRQILRLPSQTRPRDRTKAGRPTHGDHSIAKEAESIRYAYDLPGELFRLFLGDNMQYSCAYFASPDEPVEAAQERKVDYVCRKLRLRPGERFLDVGCGWGGLLLHAARKYGVEAVGVTLSEEQAEWARRAAAAAGLQDRIRVVLCDYRQFRDPAPFDKAASVGMTEHVGNRNLPGFFARVHDSLRPGGVFLHHSITLKPNTPYPRWTAFARKYVFPNGELQTGLHVQASASRAGFEVRDVENLREHYYLTLENWVRRLEARRNEVLAFTDDVGYRIFRVYLAGATMGFRSGVYNLYQCLLVRPDDGEAGLPLTRADWYGGQP